MRAAGAAAATSVFMTQLLVLHDRHDSDAWPEEWSVATVVIHDAVTIGRNDGYAISQRLNGRSKHNIAIWVRDLAGVPRRGLTQFRGNHGNAGQSPPPRRQRSSINPDPAGS